MRELAERTAESDHWEAEHVALFAIVSRHIERLVRSDNRYAVSMGMDLNRQLGYAVLCDHCKSDPPRGHICPRCGTAPVDGSPDHGGNDD